MSTLLFNSLPNLTIINSRNLDRKRTTTTTTAGQSLLKRNYLQCSTISVKRPKIDVISSITIPPTKPPPLNQSFYVSNGSLKPISSNIKSGVFPKVNATNNNNKTTSNQCTTKNQSSNVDKNIVIYQQGRQSRIVPVGVYQKETTLMDLKQSPVSKIVYCIVHPNELKITKQIKSDQQTSQIGSTTLSNSLLHTDSKKRKKKSDKLKQNIELTPIARTRSGRLSKPPSYMQKFDVTSEISQQQQHQSKIIGNTPPAPLKNDNLPIRNLNLPSETKEDGCNMSTKIKRNVPNHFRCNTCEKIYLGANKVRKHLKKYPDHEIKLPNENNNRPDDNSMPTKNLFNFLLDNIKKTIKPERIKFFLNELSDFMGKLDCLRSQLLSTDTNSTIQYIDKNVGRAFCLEPGNYHINENALLSENFNNSQQLSPLVYHHSTPVNIDGTNAIVDAFSSNSNANHPPIEYNLNNISLDSISNSKIMHLPESMSNESLLLQSVEELVKERIKNLPDENVLTTNNVVSFDHISDNAVEAAVGNHHHKTNDLDLSLDLFRFHTD